MSSTSTLHLIVNPAAGRGRGGRACHGIARGARELGYEIQEYVTSGRGHAITIAANLPEDGAPLLVLGGDGTLNVVINGLLQCSHPVGLVPIRESRQGLYETLQYRAVPKALREVHRMTI